MQQTNGPPALPRGPLVFLELLSYCTFAVTVEFALIVNVQVLVLLLLLEQSPPQMASRPLATLRVITVPGANCATALLPVGTLIPAGLETTRSPLRPPATTPSENVVGATVGLMVKVAERVTPPPLTEIVTCVSVVTSELVIVTPPAVAPAGIRTEFAIRTTLGLLLVIWKI